MPHLHRFYIAPDTPETGEIILSRDEAHHALHVVRLREGELVALFDGRGRELLGRVARVAKREVAVTVAETRRVPRPAPAVTLAQAWLLREKAIEFIVLHGTEVGADRFTFFRGDRSEKPPHLNPRWERTVIEACKQCGRLWLPEFEVVDTLEEALALASGDILVATADRPATPLSEVLSGGNATLVVGPEGDFTDAELEMALQRGAYPVSLGDATLRSEVAALVGLACVRYELGKAAKCR